MRLAAAAVSGKKTPTPTMKVTAKRATCWPPFKPPPPLFKLPSAEMFSKKMAFTPPASAVKR